MTHCLSARQDRKNIPGRERNACLKKEKAKLGEKTALSGIKTESGILRTPATNLKV